MSLALVGVVRGLGGGGVKVESTPGGCVCMSAASEVGWGEAVAGGWGG